MEEIARKPYVEGREMKEYIRTDELTQIIAELPLKERTDIANMNEEDVKVLQGVFDLYVRRKMDSDSGESTGYFWRPAIRG